MRGGLFNERPAAVKTKSQEFADDVVALLRARNPLLWVATREEARAEGYLVEAASAAGYVPRTWDVASGVADIAGKPQPFGSADPGETLNAIRDRANQATERGVWIMRDLPVWLGGPLGASVLRQLRNLARSLPGIAREGAQAIIVITTSTDVPSELAGHATLIEWPLPDRSEIAAILEAAIAVLPEELKNQRRPTASAMRLSMLPLAWPARRLRPRRVRFRRQSPHQDPHSHRRRLRALEFRSAMPGEKRG